MSLPKQSFGFNDDSKDLAIKLVIYDFDQTITSLHLYYELDGGQQDALSKMSDDKLLKVFGGFERRQRLIEHFDRISRKCELAIISFGWVQVIKLALKRMKLSKYFENSIIIGKDSDQLKTAGSKAKCIYKMKKKRNLKSDQVLFIDDDNQNIQKAMSYSCTVLITPRNGMTFKQMKEIEEKCGVYPSEPIQFGLELTTPKTVKDQISKHYPSQNHENDNNNNKKKNDLQKYAIKSVPDWFDNLSNPVNETPVIQIGGDQTPGSDSAEYELNVPILNNALENIQNNHNNNNNKKEKENKQENKPKNGLSLNLSSDISDYDDDDDQNEKEQQIMVNDKDNNEDKQ